MAERTGNFLKKCCLLYSLLLCVFAFLLSAYNAFEFDLHSLVSIAGVVFAFALVFFCKYDLKLDKAMPFIAFFIRFTIAMVIILSNKTTLVYDFKTMFNAASQLSQGDHSYLSNNYFYNWAYQSGFVAYEALIIKIFGGGTLPIQIINALWMGGTGLLVNKIAGKIFSNKKIVNAVSLLFAFYPAPYFLAGVLTNQHIATFLFYLGIYLLVYKENQNLLRGIAAGAAIAAGNVMRPLGIVVLLALFCYLVVKLLASKKDIIVKTLLFGASVVASYLIIFSLISFGISASGINPEGLANNLPQWKFLLGLNTESRGGWNESDYQQYYAAASQETVSTMENIIRERLHRDPLTFIKLFAAKFASLLAIPEDMSFGFSNLNTQDVLFGNITVGSALSAANKLDRGYCTCVFLLSSLSCFHWLRKKAEPRNLIIVFLAAMFCIYCTTHFIIEVQPRYRYFIMPAVFILSGGGISVLNDAFKKFRLRFRKTAHDI